MKLPQNELMYISKTKYGIKPIKKPLLSLNFISKDRYKYIFKLPISSRDYYTKRKIPNSLILPKIDVAYMTKIFFKNKEYRSDKNRIGICPISDGRDKVTELRLITGDMRMKYAPSRDLNQIEDCSVLLWERNDK